MDKQIHLPTPAFHSSNCWRNLAGSMGPSHMSATGANTHPLTEQEFARRSKCALKTASFLRAYLKIPSVCLLFLGLPFVNCAQAKFAEVPSVEQVLPPDPATHRQVEVTQSVDFNLDGTLSMQGFARPGDRKFPQLLQDLDLSLGALWKPEQITYNRFGAIVDPIVSRPFYVAASNESFFKGTKEYATTQIEKVFERRMHGRLIIVMTDLFEQDLDIRSIQQSLKTASFPSGASLAIWQWTLPFDGEIYDYDFRLKKGRHYAGNRHLYMLALGPKETVEQLRGSVDRTVAIGKPNYLLLSNELVVRSPDWLRVTTENAALKSRSPANGAAAPYSVYRVSRGCSTADITASIQLVETPNGATKLSFPGSYDVSLFGLTNTRGSWSSHELTGPAAGAGKDRAGHDVLRVKVNCAAVMGAGTTLLRIRRMGSQDDVRLPQWVTDSSANFLQFNDPASLAKPTWGEKTLNLSEFVRGVANIAADGASMATAYIYMVAN